MIESHIVAGRLRVKDDIPKPIRGNIVDDDRLFVSARVNANGACSLHSLSDEVTDGELFMAGAREAAVQLVRRQFEEDTVCPLVRLSIWTELAVPAAQAQLKGGRQIEHSGCFWRYVPSITKTRILNEVIQANLAKDRLRQLKVQIEQTARGVCTDCDPRFLQAFHERMKPLYDSVKELDITALADPRVQCDSSRLTFFLPSVDEAPNIVEIMSDVLEGMQDPALEIQLSPICGLLVEVSEVSRKRIDVGPAWFTEIAIEPYLKALGTEGHEYYLSIEEVLNIAKTLNRRVVITRIENEAYNVIASNLAGAGDIVFVEYEGLGNRGHYNRLASVDLIEAARTASRHGREPHVNSKKNRTHNSEDNIDDTNIDESSDEDQVCMPCGEGLDVPQHDSDDNIETTSDEENVSKGEDTDDDDITADLMFMPISRSPNIAVITEQDAWMEAATRLSQFLRDRPTLPASWENPKVSYDKVETPVRLPLYSCPFEDCSFSTSKRFELLQHLGATDEKAKHYKRIREICSLYFNVASPLDFVYLAISILERKQFPRVGPAVTRRTLRMLTQVYNDTTTKAVTCFVCAQIHATIDGPEVLRYTKDGQSQPEPVRNSTISYRGRNWLRDAEQKHPGTLLNNCSYELWRQRYVKAQYDRHANVNERCVLTQVEPRHGDGPYAFEQWCLDVPLDLNTRKEKSKQQSYKHVVLFGCTEDIQCKKPRSAREHKAVSVSMKDNQCRRMCAECNIPICRDCQVGLNNYEAGHATGSIPLALANDNYYGYINKLLITEEITWLECACSSLVWSTILVYYLEEPYGHLMLENVEGARGRTQARGNLFSFSVPWEDIEKRCAEAVQNWSKASEKVRAAWQLPHDEFILSALVNVHIVGGTTDLATHLKGATMRPEVVLQLIEVLRQSGYPGYTTDFNSRDKVDERMKNLYTLKYGHKAFMPAKIKEAIEKAHRATLTGTSLIQDKNATPAEPADSVMATEKTLRPISLVAQRAGKSASTAYEEHGNVLSNFGNPDLNIHTGSTMLDQHHPRYLGFANPFTMPVAVGGYDVDGKERWRRPTASDLDPSVGRGKLRLTTEHFRSQEQVEASRVLLYDVVRGMPRRIEGQYRRHWSFVPSLWNLYFREQVNLGVSLAARSRTSASTPEEDVQQDAAMGAAELYKLLKEGFYRTETNAKRRIDGDMTKLRFAEGITRQQRGLLADFSFRTRNIPGTQEIRTKIGHVCFWGAVVYGNGIFMTISPGERHNYLAIKLSRYREKDPFISYSKDKEERNWIGMDKPHIEASEKDTFSFDVPGYDIRRLILARDPLAAVLAFSVQLRKILASLLGVRMCALCPDCACNDAPCMDAFGSNAEAMGGIAGRSDGICGAIECQKVSGCLHFHFWNFVQRVHQYHSLEEIARMLEDALISAEEFKAFCTNVCCEHYPEALTKTEQATLEQEWPCFSETSGTPDRVQAVWGKERFGRIPPFIWHDEGVDYGSKDPEGTAALETEAASYDAEFKKALKENQKCAQHHIHKKDPFTGKRLIPNACRCKRDPKKCKHEFPMVDRLNLKRPLLVCKGIAKRRRLNVTGSRSMLGCTLGLRNSEWLDGTAPGLAIGLSGGNTDVKLNDRLPILAVTHDDKACKRHCVPKCQKKLKRKIRRATRHMQMIQARINGYFGGYIGKRQKIGQLETKKCIDKMVSLRERDKNKTIKQQKRAVSGRMITDVEMNGTARGAVEEVNLCVHLTKHDVICQECIRTFRTCILDGQRVLHRMALEEGRLKELPGSVHIPSTRRPQCRSKTSQAPIVDIYGYRPLCSTPFALLSIYEFMRYWAAVPLLAPKKMTALRAQNGRR